MILLLTGPPVAGKSTLGPLIAKRLERCAVIDVDRVRAMVVQPHIAPWLGEEGMTQLRLGARNAYDQKFNNTNRLADELAAELAESFCSK